MYRGIIIFTSTPQTIWQYGGIERAMLSKQPMRLVWRDTFCVADSAAQARWGCSLWRGCCASLLWVGSLRSWAGIFIYIHLYYTAHMLCYIALSLLQCSQFCVFFKTLMPLIVPFFSLLYFHAMVVFHQLSYELAYRCITIRWPHTLCMAALGFARTSSPCMHGARR